MDIKAYIYAASGIFVFIIFLAAFGRFLWRVPTLLDSSMMKELGKFIYRIMCKSGFIVIVIIMITYYICSNSPTLMHSAKVKGDSDTVIKEKGNKL